MITVKLGGGLGNQMFQFAAAKRLADKLGVGLRLDVSEYAYGPNEIRQYELDAFSIEAKVFRQSSASRLFERLRKRAKLPDILGPRIVVEPSFRFDPRILDAPNGCCLVGTFQSERYFVDHEAEIRRCFTLKSNHTACTQPILDKLRAARAVSLHIRRGDYVASPSIQKVHGVLPISYYEAAAEYVQSRYPDAHYFVFSDDPEWCRDNLGRLAPSITFVEEDSKRRPAVDLWLMSRCRHHVIANSSFSWWGAWLNPDANKVVVAPRQWFRESSIDTSDLLPASWTVL